MWHNNGQSLQYVVKYSLMALTGTFRFYWMQNCLRLRPPGEWLMSTARERRYFTPQLQMMKVRHDQMSRSDRYSPPYTNIPEFECKT